MISLKLFTPILLSALSCLATPTGAATTPAQPYTTRLDSLFAARYPSASEPGAAVIIAKGGSVLYERYFGIADMPSMTPVDSATLFNIASVSKQFTVVALLHQGVDIDRPASDFFDYPQAFWHDVTLRHLASHTSGIPDSRDRSDRNRCVFATDETSQSYFPSVKELQFKPGTAYDYLNPSFILLARVVEQSTGMPFTDYMAKNVFPAAGMKSTVYFDPAGMPRQAAHGYIHADNGWEEYDYGEETFFATRPDGGIYATARDMLAWERALASGTLLPAEKLRQAYSPMVDVSSSPWCDYQRRPNTAYGLGWFIDSTPGRSVKVYHTGDNGGFQAYVAKYPDLDIAVIVLENRNDRDRWSMATEIDNILINSNILK